MATEQACLYPARTRCGDRNQCGPAPARAPPPVSQPAVSAPFAGPLSGPAGTSWAILGLCWPSFSRPALTSTQPVSRVPRARLPRPPLAELAPGSRRLLPAAQRTGRGPPRGRGLWGRSLRGRGVGRDEQKPDTSAPNGQTQSLEWAGSQVLGWAWPTEKDKLCASAPSWYPTARTISLRSVAFEWAWPRRQGGASFPKPTRGISRGGASEEKGGAYAQASYFGVVYTMVK